MARDYSYRNLILWQRSQDLAFKIIQITQRMPNGWANAVIARQIIASATSVSANIAEGHGRFSFGAHRNHLSIAKGSSAETDSRLDMLRRLGVLSAEEEYQLHDECNWIMNSLKSKIRDLEQQENHIDQVRELDAPYVPQVIPTTNETPSGPFTEHDDV